MIKGLPRTPDEQKIDRLEHELYLARTAIVKLMSEQQQQILQSYYSCQSRDETYGWEDRIAEDLLNSADVFVDTFRSERAYCPLCGGGSSSPDEQGYSVPVGLTRHLTGWGNMHQCSVTAAASALARDHWRSKFARSEQEQAARKSELLLLRRSRETLFLTNPNGKPLLLDEGLFLAYPRNDEEMRWAEKRLGELTFKTVMNERIKSYIDEHEHYVVYADPRGKGAIEFSAYLKSTTKPGKGQKPRIKFRSTGTFRIPDAWKHDLYKKYQDWVAKSTSVTVAR